MDKYDMLAIRACKATHNKKEVMRRLRKIFGWRNLYDYDEESDVDTSYITHHLFDICVELYKDDERFVYWAAGLGDPKEVWRYGGTAQSFETNSLYQIISKIRLTNRNTLPSNFIPPLRFRK